MALGIARAVRLLDPSASRSSRASRSLRRRTSPGRFDDFYGKALDYVVEQNMRGVKVYEKMALVLHRPAGRALHAGDAEASAAWRTTTTAGFARAYRRLTTARGDPFFLVGEARGFRR